MAIASRIRFGPTGGWLLGAASLLAALVLAPVASQAGHSGCNWPMFGHDPGHSFAQSLACAQINASNVATLTEKWFFPTENAVTASTTVVNGVAYVGDWTGVMHALDAETGAELWSFAIDDHPLQSQAFGRINDSAAVDTIRVGAASIRVLLFGGEATLYALDPVDGDLLAKVDLDPRANPTQSAEVEIESSPVVAHFADGTDRIFVGMDVHNDANIGRTGMHSFALVADEDGLPTPYRFELVYKFDPETRTLRTSLTDGSGTGRGCGGIWSSPVFDPAAQGGDGLVVFGTSNCVNDDPTDTEAESEGVYAINATTGALVWEFHPRPFNVDDDDFGASPNLLPGGLVGNGGKDGRYYAFDRETGARPWTSHPAQSGHLNPHFAFGGIIATPAVGEVNGQPAIFIASALSTPIGDPNTGAPDPTLDEDPLRMLSLHAISAADGSILWRSAVARPSFGAPTYANGVVLVPSTVGLSLQAFDANTGVLLLDRPVDGAPSSSPTIVGDMVFMGTGTSVEVEAGFPPNEGQEHGLHAFSLPEAPAVPGAGILLSPQANELNGYDLTAAVPTTTRTTPIPSHSGSSEFGGAPLGTGNDVNGQNCVVTQADGSVRYVMGEDSNQGNDVADPATANPDRDGDGQPGPSGYYQGWGLFVPTSGVAGPWTLADKLVPMDASDPEHGYNFTDPPNDHLPDNTGCAASKGADAADPSDDMLFLVDLGVGAFDVPGVGSLFVYYRDAAGNFSRHSKYCRLDNHLTTAGYLAVDGDGTANVSLLLPESGRSSGGVISRYTGPFPAPTGSSCSYNLAARKAPFIQDLTSFVPISIARRAAPSGDKWVVGNVVPPMLNEYHLDGTFARALVSEQPTPGVAGIAVDAPGNVYWANLGLAPCDTILCPVDGLGTVWKLSFDPITDAPLPPVLLQSQLTYPEGMGIADPLPEPSALAGIAAGVLVLAGLHRARSVAGSRRARR